METSGIPDVEGTGGSGTSGRINGYVQRFNDTFIHSQITSEQSSLQSADTYHRLATRIDDFIADPDTNLLVPMTSVFTAVQNIVTDPTDSAPRIDMLDKANVMAQRVGTLNDQLTTIQDQFNSELGSNVDEVNLIARNLAEVNSAIVSLNNNPNAEPPNELLDKRDILLQNLSEKVNIKVVNGRDGAMNVFLGYGQSLVSGDSYNKLELQSSVYDKNDKKVMLVAEGQAGAYDLTSSLAGGDIGGLQKFKREVLDPTTNRLGQMAAGFALAFNSQQRQGIDMNGYTGQNVFTDYTNAANTVENWRADTTHNTGTAQLEVSFDDSPDNDYKKLIPTEYNLKYTEGSYTITRLSDNKVFSTGDGSLSLDTGGNLKLDGLKIKVEGKGIMADGDSFRLRPFSRVADEFKLTTTDPAKLAAASQPNHNWTAGSGNAGSAQLNISFADSPGNNVKNMKPGDYQLKYEKGDFDEFGSYTITRTSDNAVFSTL
ncbi:MAG: flagellar hook-associated protein FlgK, partial [Methylococcaceae bacterium]